MTRSMRISLAAGILAASIPSSEGPSRIRAVGDTLSIEKIRVSTRMDRYWLTSLDSAEISVHLGLSEKSGKEHFKHSFFYRRDRRTVVDSFSQVALVPPSPSSGKVVAGLDVDRYYHIPKRPESISGAGIDGEVRVLSNVGPTMTDSVNVEIVVDLQGARKTHFQAEFHLATDTIATDTVDGMVATYSVRFARKGSKLP